MHLPAPKLQLLQCLFFSSCNLLHHVQESADKMAAYAGYSGKRAAQDAAAPDAWDAEEGLGFRASEV